MKRQLYYGIIFLLAGGLLLTTCNKDYFDLDKLSDEIEWEPELVAPLVYGSMSMEDIVELVDSLGYTEVDDEGLIYIVYSDTAFKVRADTMVDVPDKLVTTYYIDSDINIPIWLGTPVGDTATFYKNEKFTFELDGNDRVDSVIIKGGQIVIDVNSAFEHTGLLTISSSQILNANRDTFSTVVNISDLSGTFSDQQIFLSDGYCLKSDIENDTSFIQINFRLDLINSGNLINPDDQCQIDASFENLDFYKVFGFIDSRDLITESGAFEIPIFAENPDLADVIFKDPRFNIFTSNSVGIPIEVELDNVVATSSRDGSTLELTFEPGQHPFEIEAPTLAQLGETVDTEININRNTSNIDQLLALAPSDITYEVIGRTKAGTLGDQHFILDTSKIELAMEAVMPLDFKSSGFAFRDTVEFNAFSDTAEGGFNTDMIKLAQVTLETTNKLPIQLEVQVYLLDENYMELDSVFDETTILLGAASVDGNGKSDQASIETNSITFPSEKIEKLKNVWYARIEARVLTTDGGVPFVKLYIDDTLDFELSMYANFRINTREL
jgi:hypothetical protein